MSSQPLKIQTCSCGRRYVMRQHERTGKWAPITIDADPAGNIHVRSDGRYRVIPKGETFDGDRHLNHFADCPDARRWGGR